MGANRASLGVQSLQDQSLKWLGRPHTRAEAMEGFRILRRAGFENINVDLIYALPGQTPLELDQEVSDILSLQSEHISLYTLTVSEGSRFFAQNTLPQDPDQQAEYYRRVTQRLVEVGLEHYEVSNFARSGFACQHNQHYWEAGDYIGLGASAHSHQQGRRSWNVAHPADYIDKMTGVGLALEAQEVLTPAQRFMEALLVGLRLTQGVDMASLARRFSIAVPSEVASKIDVFVAEGLLCKKGDRLRPTLEGLVALDEICSRLI
jgi:oxygen-independent coproporphyrinogen-3 oxidase